MELDSISPILLLLFGGAGSLGIWRAVSEIIKIFSRRQDLTFAAGGSHENRLWAYVLSMEQRLAERDGTHQAEMREMRGRLDREEAYNRYQAIQLARIAGAYEALAGKPFQFDPPPTDLTQPHTVTGQILTATVLPDEPTGR